MSARAVLRLAAAFLVGAAAAGCGGTTHVLDARIDADRELARTRTTKHPGVVTLRNGEKIHAVAVELDPDTTRWTALEAHGGSVRMEVPTLHVRSIRLTSPRPPLWKHLFAGTALGLLTGAAISKDFGDEKSGLVLWGGIGLAAGGLGGVAPSDHDWEVVGGEEPAAPPP